MYTMWTYLNGKKITVAYYLQVKLLSYQGYSILTMLSREEGKMFTNLTKSESRRKGKGTSEEKGDERKWEMSGVEEWERKVGEGGIN